MNPQAFADFITNIFWSYRGVSCDVTHLGLSFAANHSTCAVRIFTVHGGTTLDTTATQLTLDWQNVQQPKERGAAM